MPSIRITKECNDSIYFITLTVKNWYYIFDRHNRFDILTQAIIYCQKNKGLKVYAYVFMLNHIHLIIQSPDTAGFMRDFKKHTSYELIKNIRATEPNAASLFEAENNKYTIWQKTNFPKLIESADYFWQKKQYIENNPVRKEYVSAPEHWVHSSAFKPNPINIENP
ncbi:MAG: transposase [Nitrospirae bacterium]|nr:transposase [Nitrospirota bacterium]